jgi:F-type H+-transporting ATPase subunit epsilon
MAETRSGKTVRCVIVTPESTILDVEARSITLPLYDGQRGVAAGHAPFIGRLGTGAVRMSGLSGGPSEGVQSVFVEGGFVEVGHNTVTVITQRATDVTKLDREQARSELEQVRSSAAQGHEAIEQRLAATAAARAKLRAVERG